MASRSPSSSPDSATGSGTDPARPDTGEPLGGSDSDSDLGLRGVDCGAVDLGHRLEGEDLEIEFEAAADRLPSLVQNASREQLLYLYARYKQVTLVWWSDAFPVSKPSVQNLQVSISFIFYCIYFQDVQDVFAIWLSSSLTWLLLPSNFLNSIECLSAM